jgi:hypothetical protein
LVDAGIGRIEVFCEYPTTCPPSISIGKHGKQEPPTGSMTISVLLSLEYGIKNVQFMEHSQVGPKELSIFVWRKGIQTYLQE